MATTVRIPHRVPALPQLYDTRLEQIYTTFHKPGEIYTAISSLSENKIFSYYYSIYNKYPTSLSQWFSGCAGIRKLDLSGWDTSNVTLMDQVFMNCGSLEILDLSGWNTSNVTDMSSMFTNCPNLQKLTISHFDVSNVTGSMLSLFNYCQSLTELDLSGWDTSQVWTMASMFANCTSLRKIWVPLTFVSNQISEATFKPFYVSTNNPEGTHVYTDASDASSQGWGTINSNYTVHYNSTHDDFINA